MIGNKKAERLYTVVKNNTNATMKLAAFGTVKSATLIPGQSEAFVGYIFQGLSDGRLTSVYKAIQSGAITVSFMVRNPDGAYTESVLGAPKTGVMYAPPRCGEQDTTQERDSSTQLQETPMCSDSDVQDRILCDPRQASFNVLAGNTQGIAEQLGVKAVADQPYFRASHQHVQTTAAQTIYGMTKVGNKTAQTVETDANALIEQQKQTAQEERTSTRAGQTLAQQVDVCYKNKDWQGLLNLLKKHWPGIDFNKRSIMSLKSLDGIVKKYQLS